MRRLYLSRAEKRQISDVVAYYSEQRNLFETFAKSLLLYLEEDKRLKPYIHFIKYRVKDPEHLRAKLLAKARVEKQAGTPLSITKENLFSSIGDLAGVRVLHLHTEQIAKMNPIILANLKEHNCPLIEGPKAICWDRECEALFKGYKIPSESRDSMYTSVHYVIEANQQTKIRAEIQVRTLMEEVWGEVSHLVGYHNHSIDRACKDQLQVLARLTSGSTRLVDSIFKSHEESSR